MHKELEKKLVEQWSSWFNTEGDIRYTLMPQGFTLPGWLVRDYLATLRRLGAVGRGIGTGNRAQV